MDMKSETQYFASNLLHLLEIEGYQCFSVLYSPLCSHHLYLELLKYDYSIIQLKNYKEAFKPWAQKTCTSLSKVQILAFKNWKGIEKYNNLLYNVPVKTLWW